MTQETFVAVLTPGANWLLPDRGIFQGGEAEVRARLGRLNRVLELADAKKKDRKI